MKTFFVASECAPLAKVGGLADVVGALPKALKERGIDVRICLPRYQIIDFKEYKFESIAKDVFFKNEKIDIYQGFLPESQVVIYLLENEKYLGQGDIYFNEIQRFLFFSQVILEIFPAINWFPDIIHCHDWHTAIIPLLLKAKNHKSKTKTLFTIHNLAQQGKWNAKEVLDFLNLENEKIKSLKIESGGADFNILQQGILSADLINTVSPNYAREILTKEHGEGLEGRLLKRKKEVFGILNGIDEKKFNPETDPDLKFNYSLKNLKRKIENKTHLQEILNLNKDSQVPLLGFIGRLDSQKGVDLMVEITPDLIRNNCQLVILGKGALDYEKKLLQLSRKYPRNISCQIKFDPVLAQKIYAGADIFLIPSRFEPCGLGQLISMRYGAVPIVRRTGGLVDTVQELAQDLSKGSGFVFQDYNTEAMLSAIQRAVNSYKKRVWQNVMRRIMAIDFSWQASARKYEALYRKTLEFNKS